MSRSEFRFTRLPHRLENDQVTNLDAAKGTVVVRHDNKDTGVNYCPYYQDMEIRNRLTPQGEQHLMEWTTVLDHVSRSMSRFVREAEKYANDKEPTKASLRKRARTAK